MKQFLTAITCWLLTALFLCWGSFDHGLAVYLAFMYSLFPLVPALVITALIANRWSLPWQYKGITGALVSCTVVTLFLVVTGQIEFMFQAAIPLLVLGLAGFLIGATAGEQTKRNVEHPGGG